MNRIDPPQQNMPPVTGQARRTEETDTRQALQRHDPEFYRKKKDEGEEGGFKDPYEDLTDVSVPALKNFLLGLLDRAEASAPPQPAHTGAHEAHRAPATPQAAAAIGAYQAGAKRGVTPQPPTPAPQPAAAQTSAPTAFDEAAANLDRATVLDLIRDLDRLYAEGITAITLEKGEGFLASIRAGIDRARG